MQDSQIPIKFPATWAYAAGNAYIRTIPTASQTSITPGAASLADGFPPLNGTPVAAGGIPPFMQDFNGIFQQLTSWSQWHQAGGPIFYDATFNAAIGGYPKGARLSSSTTGISWISSVDSNTTNPDAGGAGWQSIQSQANLWSGVQTYSSNPTLLNGKTLSGMDTVGTTHSVIGYGTDNYIHVYSGANGVIFTNAANTINTLTLDNSGNAVFAGGITSAGYDALGAGQLRLNSGTSSSVLRNDGTSTYVLLGTSTGTFNAFRPITIRNSTGALTFDGTAVGTVFGGSVNVTKTIDASGNITANGARLRAGIGATGSTDTATASILGDFNSALGANGFQKLPSGLIIQWGSATIQAVSGIAVTYPLAFPNFAFIVIANYGSQVNAGAGACGAAPFTNSQCQLTNGDSIAHGMAYIAIGY